MRWRSSGSHPWWLFALGLCLALLPGCRQDGAAPDPSVLLVTLDTTRADRVGVYGNEAGLTPNLDRLAAQGVVFERCVTPVGTTIPSHATMLTGLHPGSHGARKNSQGIRQDVPLVAEALKNAGYATGAFVALRLLLTQAGLHRGFEQTSDPPGLEVGKSLRRGDDRVLELALEWLASLDGSSRPFFGWVHFYGPHTPLEPTPYSRAQLTSHPDANRRVRTQEFYEADWIDDPLESRRIQALYDGEVVGSDQRLGRLLDALEQSGRAESTVVIVTADHGQALGDNDYRGHDYALWNSILRVPLVVRGPGVASGGRIVERVGLVDLAPTLLELAGLPPFPGAEGRSLVSALAGAEPSQATYFAEARTELNPAEARPRFRTGHRVAVFSGRHKLLRGRSGDLLFDVEADPGEVAASRDAAPELRRRLGELAARYEKGEGDSFEKPVSEETAEALRALGYAE